MIWREAGLIDLLKKEKIRLWKIEIYWVVKAKEKQKIRKDCNNFKSMI